MGKSDYIAQADAFCASGNRRLRPLIERLVRIDNSPQPAVFRLSAYRRAFHSVGLVYQGLVSNLEELVPPADGDATPTRMIQLFDAQTLHLDRLQAAMTDRDGTSARRAVKRINRTAINIGGLATAYGFRLCGLIPGQEHKQQPQGPYPAPTFI